MMINTITYDPATERYAVLDAAGHEITTFDLTDFSDPTAPPSHIYAVRVAQIFRKIAAGEL